jgi:hypothetical protein
VPDVGAILQNTNVEEIPTVAKALENAQDTVNEAKEAAEDALS